MQIELQQIHKRFGVNHALKGVDLRVESGTIHGIIGENGAGKSTLMKILTGYLGKSSGQILIDGRQVEYDDPASAAALGIGMLYQEPQDFPPLTVLENFIVGRDSNPDNHRARQRKRLAGLAQRVHFDLDPNEALEKLTVGARQQLEFLRLLGRDTRLLILDEPTTGISDRQKELLFEALHKIRAEGRTILLVSHKLEEVEALCDRVTILRHGAVTGHQDAPLKIPQLLELMFDQAADPGASNRPEVTIGEEVLEFDHVTAQGEEQLLEFEHITAHGERTGLHDCSAAIRQGEVVGLAGLTGSGQGLFLRVAASLQQPLTGTARLHGSNLYGGSHRAFRRAGGAFLPSDRLEEGLIEGFSISDHFALAYNCGSRSAEKKAEKAIAHFRIHGRPDSLVESLSGGNQQRLLLSLIPHHSSLVLLENPTRGLDVASSKWVWQHLRKRYAAQGAIIFSSAELDEILEQADRVLVFFDGRIVRDLQIDQLEYQDVAAAMTGE